MRWWRRRKSFAGQEWANRDVRIATAFLVSLLAAAVDPVFFWAVLAVVLYAAFLVGRYYVRKHRAEQRNAGNPYWLDDIKDPD